MTLDSLLAHIPAWREFFVEPWSAIAMTPEKHTVATQLEQKHRSLSLELKQWQLQVEPPPPMFPNWNPTNAAMPMGTAVPIALWLALKNGMVAHLHALIKANREAFDEL